MPGININAFKYSLVGGAGNGISGGKLRLRFWNYKDSISKSEFENIKNNFVWREYNNISTWDSESGKWQSFDIDNWSGGNTGISSAEYSIN